MSDEPSEHAARAVELLERFPDTDPPDGDASDLAGQRQYILVGAVVHALPDIADALRSR